MLFLAVKVLHCTHAGMKDIHIKSTMIALVSVNSKNLLRVVGHGYVRLQGMCTVQLCGFVSGDHKHAATAHVYITELVGVCL